jgi:uncharacterized protein (TIGR02145 family)
MVIFITSCKKDTPDPFAGDSGTFKDNRDGNEYGWVRIGEQVWMAENLAYLPEVYPESEGSEDDGKENDSFYYVYDYNGTDLAAAKATENYSVYGVLYNLKAAVNSCPNGWHVPTDAEWIELEEELGITEGLLDLNVWRGTDEGGKLKEVGSAHWESVNEAATDIFGFTALPGGFRGFSFLGQSAFFYTSTTLVDNPSTFIYRVLGYDRSTIIRSYSTNTMGMSVRCIKD